MPDQKDGGTNEKWRPKEVRCTLGKRGIFRGELRLEHVGFASLFFFCFFGSSALPRRNCILSRVRPSFCPFSGNFFKFWGMHRNRIKNESASKHNVLVPLSIFCFFGAAFYWLKIEFLLERTPIWSLFWHFFHLFWSIRLPCKKVIRLGAHCTFPPFSYWFIFCAETQFGLFWHFLAFSPFFARAATSWKLNHCENAPQFCPFCHPFSSFGTFSSHPRAGHQSKTYWNVPNRSDAAFLFFIVFECRAIVFKLNHPSVPKGTNVFKVVLQQILLFILYPAAACGGATKQRETFHLPSNLFAVRGRGRR